MEYQDEVVLEKREKKKQKKFSTLDDGFYMDGNIMRFNRETLLDIFSIMLPDTMKLMPDELAKIKYPSEFRPQRIVTSMDLSVNFGFSAFLYEMETENIDKLVERMQEAIHRSNPDYRMYEREIFNKINGCWFSFRSHAMDSDVYNMLFVISVDEIRIQGCFNCLYQDYPKWHPLVLMIWESIEAIKED